MPQRKSQKVHLVIGDTQVTPDTPTRHLEHIGKLILDFKNDDLTVVHLGDHWDMPSLSSYDRGTGKMIGRSYLADVQAGNEAFAILNKPLDEYNARQARNGRKRFRPRRVLLRGNHEDRITRAVNQDPQLEGLLSLDLLESPGWEVHDFLDIVWLDGVAYSHYFAAPLTGRAMGGTALLRLTKLGHSYVMGHVQTLDYAMRYVGDRSQHGLIMGACYTHDEEYRPQGNNHFRGVAILRNVENGSFDPEFISLDSLSRRFTGMPLAVAA